MFPTVRGRVCAGCGYDLELLEVDPICPECGRAFDPADPRTTMSTAAFRWRSRIRGRWGLVLALAIFLAAAALQGLLPQPRGGSGLRLWTWFGYDFGVAITNTTQSEYLKELRWAGRTLRIESWTRADPSLGTAPVRRWWARRHDADEFELAVEALHVESRDVIWAIGAVRYDEMLGVRIGASPPGGNLSTFRVRGSKADVLSEVIRQYAIAVTPFKITEEQTHVWIWDEGRNALSYVTVEEAERRGLGPIETQPVWRRMEGRPVRAIKPSGFTEPPAPPEPDPATFVGPPAL